MCGSVVQLQPKGIIRKSPQEEIARVEILAKLAGEGVASRRFTIAVSGLSSLVERGCNAEVRECAIWGLMNTLLGNPRCINDGSIRVIVRAIGDSEESVSTTAESAAMVLARDFLDRAVPILLEEISDSGREEASKKMRSTVSTIFQLASSKEKAKLEAIIRRYGMELEGRSTKSVRMRRDKAARMPHQKKAPPKKIPRAA
jgi:hypothetical protein